MTGERVHWICCPASPGIELLGGESGPCICDRIDAEAERIRRCEAERLERGDPPVVYTIDLSRSA